MMLRVGITGGIGTGKTTVCQIFETLGIPVYYADVRAKWLTTHDPGLVDAIRQLLGSEAYLADGSYNRAYVAGIVFKDAAKLSQLNALVHPAVEHDSRQWHLSQQETGAPYTLHEAALLIESGHYLSLDTLILVTAPEELRIRRVVLRDKVSADQVRARMQHQIPDSEKVVYAGYKIDNDGDQLLIPQVMNIHRQLTQRAQQPRAETFF